MFGEDLLGGTSDSQLSKEDKMSIHNKYTELKKDFLKFKGKAKNSYDFFNLIEKSILEMEGEEQSNRISEGEVKVNGMLPEDLQRMC